MGLDKVVEDILRKGAEQKNRIIRLGEQERDAQQQLADKRIAEDQKRAEERASSVILQMEQQELSSAELESKKNILAAQRQVLEDLKAQVLTELEGYPQDKRKLLYSKLMSKAKKELGDCYVYSNAADRAALQVSKGITLGGTMDCRGGLVFESKDRSVRLDYRFESVLDEVWNRNMREIFAKLFG
jgi:V/A-type H+-transporting ATPase subunit E